MSIFVCSSVTGCGYVGNSKEWADMFHDGHNRACPRCHEDHFFQVTQENIMSVTNEHNRARAMSLMEAEGTEKVYESIKNHVYRNLGTQDEYAVIGVVRSLLKRVTYIIMVKSITNMDEAVLAIPIEYIINPNTPYMNHYTAESPRLTSTDLLINKGKVILEQLEKFRIKP